MTETRRCAGCSKRKPIDEFIKDKRKPGGRGYRCLVCHNLRCQQYQATEAGKENVALRQRKRYHKDPSLNIARRAKNRKNSKYVRDPFKEIARHAVSTAVRSGRLKKPPRCEDCGKKT